MVTFFGLGRLIIDFYRDDPTLFGLTAGQYLSLIMLVLGSYVLSRYYRQDVKNMWRGG
jgi:prolipoprotein diacylglyceryltransferase